MDKSTFQQKLQQYKDMVYRIAYTYLRNTADAEDVSQETFLKFYQLSKPFTDAGLEKAWLIRVTLNACHNLRKSVWYNPKKFRSCSPTPPTTCSMKKYLHCRNDTALSSCSIITRNIPFKRLPT